MKHLYFLVILFAGCTHIGKPTKNSESLSDIYYDKGHNYLELTPPAYDKANEFFKKSCKLHNKHGCYNLGHSYYTGEIGKPDYNQALKWFKKAESMEHTNAAYYLGLMYLYGQGTDKNIEKSIGFFEKSSNFGNHYASYNLGIIHYKKEYNRVNYVKSQNYLELALNQNLTNHKINAQYLLADIYLFRIPQLEKKETALNFLVNNINNRDGKSALTLSSFYAGNKKIQQKYEPTLSLKYLYIAKELGVSMANKHIKDIYGLMTPEQISEAKKQADEYMKQLNAKNIH